MVGHAFTFGGVVPPFPEGWVYAIGWHPDMLFKRAADCKEGHREVDDGEFEYMLTARSHPTEERP
jgi:hypothetical protein